MKDYLQVFFGAIVAVFIGSVVALLVVRPATISKFGDTTSGYALNSTVSGSVSLPTGTSTVVSLPDTARLFGYLCNTDANANDYLGFSNNAQTGNATPTATQLGLATTTAGVVIFPKTCYEMGNKGNILWSQINATTASSATTTLFYMFGH